MKKIAIQAGHWNIKYNCVTGLQSGTGAPQESGTNVAVAIKLEKLLQERGFSTFLTDANYNCDPNSDATDYALFISLHCDANYAGDEGGGFVDFPEPSTDGATAESQRIAKAIESVYFQESGIRNVPSRSNSNTRYYYMWASLSSNTPCVLIEMGESVDPHDRTILNDTDRIAKAIANGIFKAFPDVVAPTLPPTPTDPCANIKKELDALKKEHAKCGDSTQTIISLRTDLLNTQTELKKASENLVVYKKQADDFRTRLNEIHIKSE